MIIGSTKEDLSLEKRVALTPESAKNIIGLGLKVCIEKNLADHIGISDKEYEAVGAEIKNSSDEVFITSNMILKVNCPTENEINKIKEKTILVGMFNPSKNAKQIDEILKKKNKSILT